MKEDRVNREGRWWKGLSDYMRRKRGGSRENFHRLFPDSHGHQNFFDVKMATVVSDETLDNFQHSAWLIPESRSCTFNSGREKPKD
jgi:hypothetical protein